MNIVLKRLLSLILAGILLFSIFGFLATYEPLDRSVQLTWRMIYGIAGVLCIAGLVLVWKFLGRKKN